MKKITMDIGRILLSVEDDDDDKLILYANVNTENQQEFENSLNRVFSLLERLENVKKIVFNFGEMLQVPGWFGDHCINSGIRLDAQKRQRQAMSQEIWLMRHGHHHLENGSLTEEGIERVKKAAAVLKDKSIEVIAKLFRSIFKYDFTQLLYLKNRFKLVFSNFHFNKATKSNLWFHFGYTSPIT